ncbi:MAG: hypothetical protein M3Q81_03085 [bacterium]|nr:hypothetical protein [bacterium]
MRKLLSIVGPTAVGKSAFAMEVAASLVADKKYLGIDLISADSRQVYVGLGTLSGSDVPSSFTTSTTSELQYPFLQTADGGIRLHGVEVISPTTEWSVYHFQSMAEAVAEWSWGRGSLPIIIGGTGMYLRSIELPGMKLQAGPNEEVRHAANDKTVEELQSWLISLDETTLENLNDSDRHNPRRLVRAIEKAVAANQVGEVTKKVQQPSALFEAEALSIGLQDELTAIESRIKSRVSRRLAAGAVAEVEQIMANAEIAGTPKVPALSATGVKPIMAHIRGDINLATCEQQWFTQERQYVKRQLTWWKKYGVVEWCSVGHDGWQASAVSKIKSWLYQA